ncbi:MAG: hypothetical protein JNK38_16200 [Acidobacteria bacterium]|nr:hypothetical protein [Acidobacteriota bacterium]
MAVNSKKISAATSAVQAFDAGSDPDVPVRPGTGKTPSVYIDFETKEVMGWTLNPDPTLKPPPGTVIIWISPDSEWKLEEDGLTKKMYLDIENAKLMGASVEGLEDETGKDVPANQKCKLNTRYEVILHLQKPAQ